MIIELWNDLKEYLAAVRQDVRCFLLDRHDYPPRRPQTSARRCRNERCRKWLLEAR